MKVIQNNIAALKGIVLLIFFPLMVSAQNITFVEYFIGVDPGYGNGISVPVSPAPLIDNINFAADISVLGNGFHNLFIRSMDENGRWSQTSVTSFYKEKVFISPQDIVQAEYFFDSDPGPGSGIGIPLTPAPNIANISFIADITGLSDGFHNLCVRSKDANGRWSLTSVRSFYKETILPPDPQIVAAEYFINEDPGFGQATPIAVVPGSNITLLFDIGLPVLSPGTHRICIRTKDEFNRWSLANITELIVLDVKAFLEGPYSNGEMQTLINQYLPLDQPFNPTLPWFGNPNPVWLYNGTESVASIPQDAVDWMLLEIRETAGSASTATGDKMVAQSPCFLLKDGSVVGIDGQRPVNIFHQAKYNIYLVLCHRNHLSIMSAGPVNTSSGLYDFTTGSEKVYGGSSSYSQLEPGAWGMVSGDGNADGQVNNGDKNDVWKPQAGTGGYKAGDFSLDSEVNNIDKISHWSSNSGTGSQVPD